MPRRVWVPLLMLAVLSLSALAGGGCARSRVVTISAIPPDALIRVDGRDRGPGPITETFTFPGDARHTVQAEREGYATQRRTISKDDTDESMVIQLNPVPRTVTFTVSPRPAILKLDGKPMSPDPVSQITKDIEFRVDASGRWNTHEVSAEWEGFEPDVLPLRYEDRETTYTLNLEAKRKDLIIAATRQNGSELRGAEVFLNDSFFGITPMQKPAVAFPVDNDTGELIPYKVRLKKPGYQDKEATVGWDEGKINYAFAMSPNEKVVRITTTPPDAQVKINDVEIKRDASGVFAATLPFPPTNEKGDSTPFTVAVSRAKTADAEWEPKTFQIPWEGGKTDYNFKLREILIRRVEMLLVEVTRENNAWAVAGKRLTSIGMKDVGDTSPAAGQPTKVTRLPKDTKIDTVAVSPEGSHVLFTTLSEASPGELRSQILMQRTDGPPDTKTLSEGSLEITPAFAPDGSRIVFASNRAGRRLNIWSLSVIDPQPIPEQLTMGESNDLWPTVDSNPQPRLFYESRIDMRPDPRLFSTPLGMATRKDLSRRGGTQPRVAPTADAVLFCLADPKTNKRDIFRMSDEGRDMINLTATPNEDEFDPAWSADGRRVAYVSDVNRSPKDAPDNFDIYVIDAAGGSVPVRVTTNGSWDDSPAWEGNHAIYFRSNRGAEWNVWRVELK